MNIEELIRTELEAAVSTVPAAAPAPLGDVERRGQRRVVVARFASAAAGAAVFAAVVAVSVAIGRIGYTPDVADTLPTTVTTVLARDGEVVIAGEVFPVDGLVEAFSDAPMYFGELAPPPSFDISSFGAEFPLGFGQARVADPDVLDGPTVYVGEAGDESVFLNEQRSDGGVVKCLWIGPTPQLCADSGAFELASPPRPGPPYGTWLGVPEGTSVVVLRSDGVALGWQQPVGGVALISLPGQGVFELAAFGADGAELGTVGVTVGPPADLGTSEPGGPTTTVP